MLLVLKAPEPESAEAPEFRYLFSHLLLQARRVFGEVRLATGFDGLEAGDLEAVLLLGRENVLLAAASLEAMRERLRRGAGQVRPYRLAEAGLADAAAVYTLRGYERLEARFLAEGPAGAVPPASHLPAALFAPAALAALARRVPPAALLAGREALVGLAEEEGGTIGFAGLCHEFIDYYGEVRADVLPFVPPGTEVLEVGCGRGVTGELLQRELGCRVTGVELNPVVAREAATRLHAVLHGDVQTLAIGGRYDVVLGLEVVEHLPDAEGFLTRARDLLRPGGRIVCSIPNVGHHSVVEDLFAGRWDYLPIGLLCYTHFRFFTRRTLADWLARCGFDDVEIVPQRTELPERFASLPGFELDLESLATKGFYVIARR